MPKVSTRTVQSFKKAGRKIGQAAKQIDAELGKSGSGLRIIGEEIMADVKASRPGAGVPRRHGILAGTGRVEGPRFRGGRAEVELSFGGSSAPYAVVQHERTDFHHKRGEARYLVRGLERWQPGGSAGMEAIKANAAAGLAAASRK